MPHTMYRLEDTNGDGIERITVGESVTYFCKPGFEATSGDTIRTCDERRQLLGEGLVCKCKIIFKSVKETLISTQRVLFI